MEKIKDIYTRDVLLTIMLIIALSITCFLILASVSSIGKYDEKIAEYTDESGYFIEGKGIAVDDYENLLMVQRFNSLLMFAVTAFTVINCILVTGVWINRRRQEFAVRKAFGATTVMLAKRLMIELMALTASALVISSLLYIICTMLGVGGLEIHGTLLKSLIIVLATALTVDYIAVRLNVRKLSKLSPVELLNTGKD